MGIYKNDNTIMIYIILISIFKSFADALKPDQFDRSRFAKYKGTWWDVRAMEGKYHDMHVVKYIFCILFGDAWHFSNMLIISTFITGLYYFDPSAYNFPVHFIFLFTLYGVIFELMRIILMGKNYKYQ